MKRVLFWEFRSPQRLREAWRKRMLQLPEGFWPLYRFLGLIGKFLVGAAVVVSQVYTAYLNFLQGNVMWGCLQATFAILFGAYLIVVIERRRREGSASPGAR